MRHPVPTELPPTGALLPYVPKSDRAWETVVDALRTASVHSDEGGFVADLAEPAQFWTAVISAVKASFWLIARGGYKVDAPNEQSTLIVETYELPKPQMIKARIDSLSIVGVPLDEMAKGLQHRKIDNDPDGVPVNPFGRDVEVWLRHSFLSIPQENIAGMAHESESVPVPSDFRKDGVRAVWSAAN